MSAMRMQTNVKLAKLFYKYLDDEKEQKTEEEPPKKQPEPLKDYEKYPPYNFSWFIDNKVAAMGWPQTVENLNYLADVGVDHLITLSPERRPPILECKKKLKWSEIRIKEFAAPSLRQILKFIEICERAQLRGEVIGIHCRQGRGRTGTMLACYLVHYKDMAPERAILTVRVQRPGSCETYEQEKIVCHYHDCIRGTLTKPDYRLVEDKHYFDCSMKYMDSDEGSSKEDEHEENKKTNKVKTDSKTTETLQLHKKNKTKAMVINHKIYF